MIRALKAKEANMVYDLAKEGFSFSKLMGPFDIDYLKETWVGFIEDNLGVVLGLFENGELRGLLAGISIPNPSNGEILGIVSHWFLHKNGRGSGIKLLVQFEEWAKKKGCKKVICSRNIDASPKLEKVYSRYGYRPSVINYEKEI